MSAQGSQAAPTASSGRAPRGSACLNCRRRKFKCDGARPVCGPCTRTNREYDCEYTDGPTRSPTQLLEDNVARLEARIYELEHPESVAPSVTLHDPRTATAQAGPSLQLTPVATSSTAAAGPSTQGTAYLIPQATPVTALDATSEPSPDVVQMLVGFFLPHANQVGFFLHHGRFREYVSIPAAEARQARLSPALLNAMYLWGVHFSGNASLFAHEPVFLQRAVQSVSAALVRAPPYNIIYSIQAEVLLAHYFFAANRPLEGRYHTNAAVALSLSCRLNKLRSNSNTPNPPGILNVDLAPPTDALEEGERINAFWSVFILDKSWSVRAGSPSHFNGSPGAQVDTPWPLQIEDYTQRGLPAMLRSSLTIQAFLSGMSPEITQGTSPMALRAKASALFERASRLASQWTPAMAYVEQFAAEFFVLENIIEQFIAALPPLHGAVEQGIARDLLVTHTFALVASMQVLSALRQGQNGGPGRDLEAARRAITAFDSVNLGALAYVDPIMAVLWTAVCRVLIGEIVRLRMIWTSTSLLADQAAAGAHQQQHVEADHDGLIAALQKVLTAMTTFAQTSPLMALEAAKVRQELEQSTR
ncbi:uncharacterized protein B0H18DRAFT_1120056 [Fomitopsis serialis]|uniref:uncharacterized protein n=1 Tax=Fomitopsis serialis TaxID=139415 RepID=UPI002007C622|nr:uncharacterized protein B0H18DRAFT_1122760 [Neoantrodia serialis]XP_047892390.1 uncharacterized protein B0H18DRAFT_1120056 [Neoantrodia serialis]KAH9918952.1 hypothetical protein B0H18DRAFT_1122760 [Neoantrodia serialis]KAH9924202.1 hypothetical protein B0H18DRAFT_1120056 [Neoantrodia serialis]